MERKAIRKKTNGDTENPAWKQDSIMTMFKNMASSRDNNKKKIYSSLKTHNFQEYPKTKKSRN